MPASRRSTRRSKTMSRSFSISRIATVERGGGIHDLSRGLMFDFDHRLFELQQQCVLCIGDLMLDEFLYGEVSRISPEAPAPVIAVARQEAVVGGAGNVARNIAALGARCRFVGVIGDDEAGRSLRGAAAS